MRLVNLPNNSHSLREGNGFVTQEYAKHTTQCDNSPDKLKPQNMVTCILETRSEAKLLCPTNGVVIHGPKLLEPKISKFMVLSPSKNESGVMLLKNVDHCKRSCGKLGGIWFD